MSAPPVRPGGGMSGLYANLLGDSSTSSATISKAPVVFSKPAEASSTTTSTTEDSTPAQAAASAQKKINAAALRFQPTITKRPTPATKKSMNFKPIGMPAAVANKSEDKEGPTAPATVAKPVVKTTLEDWVGDDEDVNGFYSSHKDRPRGGRKKRKKNKATPPPPTNWDDVYDPLRPNSYEEYKEGDEKIREMEDWRERLYGKKRRRYDDSSDSEDDRRPVARGFAPPSNYSFAPPPSFAPPAGDASPPPPPTSSAPPPPPVEVPDDISGEDAFARRMRMSQQGAVGYSGISQAPTEAPPPPPPPQHAPAPPSPTPSAVISRAPVMFEQPVKLDRAESPEYEPEPESSEPSLRPGQSGFAKRLMEKQGWKAGQGLGKDGSGITKAIQMVQAGKKDGPARGKIIDKNKPRKDLQKGERSQVVHFRGIIDGKKELFDHGELMQKVGDEYKRYGRVVQIVINWDEEGERADVYVLFADEGTAQMAVNGLQRREIFEGNTTTAEFYSKEKFEARDFE
ncbi:Similar to DNA-damage-repair/toleration protein DRT111, chloroplastic; acc. no. P42698 [Pyronema omphalodes CBS 100304]|uniref:Similar to DNA-damage-repair/toleration protein DRT111, chloroplastic acc. no. P42698 n=1 Tax=Pyronema omphalodes (strain CBS 100304) TaxID=1076935 RepID=U4KVD0_PYROM|nr:Similar to DNA-damage-repair/toleration protein DRT111, chloroplastic; acc. no. P42698 [Pyronema omphalodes CBS 100304]